MVIWPSPNFSGLAMQSNPTIAQEAPLARVGHETQQFWGNDFYVMRPRPLHENIAANDLCNSCGGGLSRVSGEGADPQSKSPKPREKERDGEGGEKLPHVFAVRKSFGKS